MSKILDEQTDIRAFTLYNPGVTGGSASPQGWEIPGGTTGSVVGFATGLVAAEFGNDGIGELAANLAIRSGLGSAAGARIGGRIGGRLTDGDPSPWGALLGGAVGTVAAVGVATSLDDSLRGDPSGVIHPGYSVTRGSFSGLDAWLLGRCGGG